MNREQFQSSLQTQLDQYAAQAIENIMLAIKATPEKAIALDIGIYPNQEGDGFFSILASVDGPNLHFLNKPLREQPYIFDVKYIDGKVVPDVPLVDPFDVDFDVNDALVDISALWIKQVWKQVDEPSIPTNVTCPDYGTVTPIKLC